ncbi:MAG TPA: TetR/AcrR family transcriptional regulator [Acidimicrobiia bacterium]|nr:TetR/AcrR family transcriptional regulator [Acidimicrobiia bacterium]
MVKTEAVSAWRAARRRSARDAIVDAAWALAREEGLAGFSLRDLARRAGITTPTVYAYFESKNAIYDAMFGHAARQFAEEMSAPHDVGDPRDLLVAEVRRFFDFCLADAARYQLLFQRALPEFEPSAESYAPAVQALAVARDRLAMNGVSEARYVDLFTALVTGLVDQQVANDPGGDRWTHLLDEAIDMFLAYCQPARPTR